MVSGGSESTEATCTSSTPLAHVNIAAHMLVLEKLDDSGVVTGSGSGVERACFLQRFDVRNNDAEMEADEQGKQREEEASEPAEQASSHRPQVRAASGAELQEWTGKARHLWRRQ